MASESSLLFELARDSDCEEIALLVNSAYRGDVSRQGWTTEADFLEGQRTDATQLREEIHTPEHRIYLAREPQTRELLGCVKLEDMTGQDGIPRTYLGMLTVRPDLQDAGLGRKILALAEDSARQAGSQVMEMSVIHIRDTLLAWYERRGYRRNGKTKPFPYGQERFGLPQREDLHFVFLEKDLGRQPRDSRPDHDE